MPKRTICYGCHNTKEMLDYTKSREQGKDIWKKCGGCDGKGYIYEDNRGNRIFKQYDESEEAFESRVDKIQQNREGSE